MTVRPGRIRRGNVELHFLVSAGTGPPVVILHGLAGSASEFLPTATALTGNRVVLVDSRGHGNSTRRPADVSRDAHVADAVRVLEEIAGEPATLVGHSMGGHTAMLTAAARPDLVSRLVLLEAGVGGDGTVASRQELRAFLDSWPVPFASEQAATDFLGTGPLERAWVADLEAGDDGLRPRFDADVMVETIAAVDALPRWTEWETVSARTLVLFAEHGMFTPAQRAEFVARGRNIQSVDIPAAGHDAHLDSFATWIAHLREFLTQP